MSALEDTRRYWDGLLVDWGAGARSIPPELSAWHGSYRGSGRGQVDLDAFPEPYVGQLEAPAVVLLGLNPGRSAAEFQGPNGIFTRQIAGSSYSAWASSAPYSSVEWESRKGRNVYHRSRLKFAQTLLQRPDVRPEQILTMELYPWHSVAVTAAMRPPGEALKRFVWDPLAETGVGHVFAFGKPWIKAAHALGFGDGEPLEVAWDADVRRARTFTLPSGQCLVVVHQSGYAGPPSPAETMKLKTVLGIGGHA